MSLAARLAAFAHEAKPDESARAVMRQSVYDWMACGIAGVAEPVARIVRAQALDDGGAPVARLFGGGDVPARAAALVNGTISHALDYDDTHFAHIGHPSVAILPAVMAVGQGAGEEIVDAALVGAEVSVRVGQWFGRDHYQRGFHQTATAGAFGATLAVARLRGLDARTTQHALGLAATRAAGLKSQFGTMGKPFNAGLAAECGVVCADLAARGFVSNPGALDGPQGFAATHAAERDMAAFDGMGTGWRMTGVSHKLHACCHGLHAAIEALAPFRGAADRVAGVEVTTHPRWLTVCNIEEPRTGLEAKFSYRHAAAMVLAGCDTAATESFSDASASDGALVRLRRLVRVRADADLAETGSEVRVTARDGAETVLCHDLAATITHEEKWRMLRRKGRALVGGREDRLFGATAERVDADTLRDLMS